MKSFFISKQPVSANNLCCAIFIAVYYNNIASHFGPFKTCVDKQRHRTQNIHSNTIGTSQMLHNHPVNVREKIKIMSGRLKTILIRSTSTSPYCAPTCVQFNLLGPLHINIPPDLTTPSPLVLLDT